MKPLPLIGLLALALAARPAFAVTVDGDLDPDYGPPLVTQTTQTQYDDTYGYVDGSNGSELDAGFAVVANNTLYLFLAGNIYEDWMPPELNAAHEDLSIFFDTTPGGQSPLRADNPALEGLNVLPGLKFDTDFTPDYWIGFHPGGWPVNPFYTVVSYSTLPSGSGGAGYVVGNGAAGAPGTLTGGTNPYGILASIDNRNGAGVNTGCGAASGASASTGIELAIPLTALGNPTGCIKVCAMISYPGYSVHALSNQILGPVPPGTCELGDPMITDLSAIPGTQYFNVCPLATPTHDSSWGRVKTLYR
jgi:hypothetical protein